MTTPENREQILAQIAKLDAESVDISKFELDFAQASTPASDDAARLAAEADAAMAERAGGGIKKIAQNRSDVFDVSPHHITVVPGWNARDFTLPKNQRHVVELAHMIAKDGVQNPLQVRLEGGKLVLTHGESRLRAVHYAINVLGAPIRTVPVIKEARGTNDSARELSQLKLNKQNPLTALEEATPIVRLHRLGWTVEQIAAETGYLTPVQVEARLRLAELPEAIKSDVSEGRITPTEAVRVLKHTNGDATEAKRIIDDAVKESEQRGGRKAGRATARTLANAIGKSQTQRDVPISDLRKPAGGMVRFSSSGVKTLVADILSRASVDNPGGNRRVTIEMSARDWKELAAAVGYSED